MLLKECSEEFIFNCECRKLSPKTIRNYEKQISYLLAFLEQEHEITELDKVTTRYIKEFLVCMSKKGRKPAYINDLLKAFKVFFRYLYNEEYSKTIVTDKIKNAKGSKTIIKPFSPKDIKGILEYYSGRDFLSVRNRTMIAMFFDTGVRLNELITFTETQIYHDYLLIHGKGDKERVVPKSPLLGKSLMQYKRIKDDYCQYRAIPYNNFFLSKNGKPLTAEAVSKVLKIAASYVGVNSDIRVSPHTCRHTFAHMQLQNGLNLYSLSRLMGHENISITQRYLEGISDRNVLKEAQGTSPLMNL